MSYIVENDLLADLPSSFLAEALNDGPDGTVAFSIIGDRASEAVDAILVQRVTVPVGEAEDGYLIAKEAARIFALESIYKRRGAFGDANPWTAAAEYQRNKLRSIVKKEQPFGNTVNKKPSASAITGTARSHSDSLSA